MKRVRQGLAELLSARASDTIVTGFWRENPLEETEVDGGSGVIHHRGSRGIKGRIQREQRGWQT